MTTTKITICVIKKKKIQYTIITRARTVRHVCVTGTNRGQRKHNEFRACDVLVPNVRLALVWPSFDDE